METIIALIISFINNLINLLNKIIDLLNKDKENMNKKEIIENRENGILRYTFQNHLWDFLTKIRKETRKDNCKNILRLLNEFNEENDYGFDCIKKYISFSVKYERKDIANMLKTIFSKNMINYIKNDKWIIKRKLFIFKYSTKDKLLKDLDEIIDKINQI